MKNSRLNTKHNADVIKAFDKKLSQLYRLHKNFPRTRKLVPFKNRTEAVDYLLRAAIYANASQWNVFVLTMDPNYKEKHG